MSDDAPLVRTAPPAREGRRKAIRIALALAIPLWLARNLVSDRLFVAATERAGTEEAYKVYVQEGWLSVAAMTDALPRIAFEEARKQHSPEALRQFLENYAASPFAGEARKTLASQYASAHNRYREQSAAVDPKVRAAVDRVLESMQASGVNTLAVEAVAPTLSSISAADLRAQISSGRQRSSNLVLISTWLRPTATALSERLAKQLSAGFAEIASPALISVRSVGATTPAAEHESRLVVDYTVGPSGAFFEVARREYMAMAVSFHTRLFIDAAEPAINLSFTVSPWTEAKQIAALRSSVPTIGLTDVYTPMLVQAFDAAVPQFAALFFDRSSAAFRRASVIVRSTR